MGTNIHTAKVRGEGGGCKKFGLEINAARTKYVFTFHKQNAGQNYKNWEVPDPLKRYTAKIFGNNITKKN